MIGLVIVCEVRLYRDGLAKLLGADPRFEVAGTAGTIADGLAAMHRTGAATVLLDAGLGEGAGAVTTLLAVAPEASVVVMSVSGDQVDVLAMAGAGACACVTRDSSLDDLVTAVEYAERSRARAPARDPGAANGHAPRGGTPLTPRELEILGLIKAGRSNKQIAGALCIELSTVKNHVHSVLRKLGAARRTEAVTFGADLLDRAQT